MPDIPMPSTLLGDLHRVLGERGLLTGAGEMAAAGQDWRRLYDHPPLAVLRPDSAEAVAASVRVCLAAGVAVVPQGGNTSMVGGGVPSGAGQVVVSLARMNRIRALDPVDMTHDGRGRRHAEGRPGRGGRGRAACCRCPSRRRARRRSAACWRPMPAATTPCATATRATWCLGWRRCCRTARVERPAPAAQGQHRLLPAPAAGRRGGHARHHHRRRAQAGAAPAEREVALCAVPSPDAALTCSAGCSATTRRRCRRSSTWAAPAWAWCCSTSPAPRCRSRRPRTTCLIDLATPAHRRRPARSAGGVAGAAMEDGIVHGRRHRRERGAAPRHVEAAGGAFGGAEARGRRRQERRVRSRVPRAGAAAAGRRRVAALIPGVRCVPFGHIGDGNIHFNFEQPVAWTAPAFLARDHAIMDAVGAVVRELDGSLLRRARGRPAEALHDAGLARRGGAGRDAADQGGARPAGIDEPGESPALNGCTSSSPGKPELLAGPAG